MFGECLPGQSVLDSQITYHFITSNWCYLHKVSKIFSAPIFEAALIVWSNSGVWICYEAVSFTDDAIWSTIDDAILFWFAVDA